MALAPPVFKWFEQEVMPVRVLSSIIRGLIFQLFSLFLFNCVISFSPFSPIQWLKSNIILLVTPSSWFYDLIAFGSFAGLALVQAKQFQMVKLIPDNRIWMIKLISQPRVLVSLIAHVSATGLLVRCLLGLQGGQYNSLTILCSGDLKGSTCLNEGHVFLVLAGCYLGLCLWFDFHFRSGNAIEFPLLLNQSGNAQLKRSLGKLFKKSIIQVICDMRWFYIAYFIFVYRVEHFLSDLFGIGLLSESMEHSWSSSVWVQLWLFFHCWSLLTLASFCIRLMKQVLIITFTKPLTFKTAEDLIEAMGKKTELIGHLASLDFSCLAASSKERRADFFTLSQPGGHAHAWNKLSGRCQTMLNEFLRQLNESSQALRASHQASQLAKTQEEKEVRRPGPLFTSGSGGVQDLRAVPQKSVIEKQSNLATKICNEFSDRVHKIPIMATGPDAALRNVFAHSQTIIWTVEGLSHLIAASVHEDQFGVVQKDLPDILIVMLTLQQTVDRHKGFATSSTKKNRCETRDQQLKYELRSAIKSSLYRIVLAFGNHIGDVPLPPDQQKHINSFLNFMEG